MIRSLRETALNPAMAFLVCCLGGWVCSLMATPLPWLIGPLVLMAALNFGGASLRAPPGMRACGQVIIGVALGLYFTPAVAREVVSHGTLLLVAAGLAIAIGWICAALLGRLTGVDPTTAFFSSVPGGAAEMAVLAERFGGRVDRVAIAQSLRVLVVVVVIPFTLTYSGVHGSDAYRPAVTAVDWPRLVALFAIAVSAGGALALLRAPNAFMLGPLFAVIALTVGEIHFSALPTVISNLGQLFIACALGSRFERRFVRGVPMFVVGVLSSVVLAMAVSTAMAWVLSRAYGISWPTLILAVAPGGVAEMSITAKVLQLGVPLVTSAHVVRVLVLVTLTGPLFALLKTPGQATRKS